MSSVPQLATNNLQTMLESIEAVHAYRDPEARLTVHHKQRDSKTGEERFVTWGFHKDELQNTLPGIMEGLLEESYFSQNAFIWRERPTRRAGLVRWLNTCWIDLDVYNVGLTAEQALPHVWQAIEHMNLPKPNRIIHSGRGLYVYWFLDSVRAWPENVILWTDLQKAFCRTFERLGADYNALDVSRILRIAGTWHRTARRIVQAQHLHDDRYTLEELAQALDVPDRRRKRRAKRGKGKVIRGDFKQEARAFNLRTLNLRRAADLETLNELRGGMKKGTRELACFFMRNFLQDVVGPEEALRQALEFNTTFDPPLNPSEVKREATPAQRYRYTNAEIIERLRITPEEQRHLSTIIGRDEKNRRRRIQKAKARRAQGVRSRAEYRADCKRRREATDAAVLEAFEACPGATQWEIAAEVGVNQSTVSRALRRMGLQTRTKGNPKLQESQAPIWEPSLFNKSPAQPNYARCVPLY